jgi:hypothetical protein
MLGAHDLWVGRDLYQAILVVIRGFGFRSHPKDRPIESPLAGMLGTCFDIVFMIDCSPLLKIFHVQIKTIYYHFQFCSASAYISFQQRCILMENILWFWIHCRGRGDVHSLIPQQHMFITSICINAWLYMYTGAYCIFILQ